MQFLSDGKVAIFYIELYMQHHADTVYFLVRQDVLVVSCYVRKSQNV